MKVQFFFGPDKVPFSLNDKGIIKEISNIPFHGIISRGLLNRFISRGIEVELWHQYPHLLFDIDSNVTDLNLEKLRDEILASKVLSFAHSSFSAKKYVEQICGIRCHNAKIELWNIKEGHTSSVWKASIKSDGQEEIFVVNVARDFGAGIELKETSEKLLAIGNAYPEINLAKVLEISFIKDDALPFEVIVTKNVWIENSYEIHQRPNNSTGSSDLVLVERFLIDENNPSKITSIIGRRFSESETRKINHDINYFITKASTCLASIPSLNINEGDVVWDGEKAIVVALNCN